jgi:toxin FitB
VKALLDTSVVVAGDVGHLGGELSISAVSLAELHFGVLVARTAEIRAERLRRLGFLLRELEPLPVDSAVASSYGTLAAAVVAQGRQPRARPMDLLIAATAHAHGATLYTRNAGDLAGLEAPVEIEAV